MNLMKLFIIQKILNNINIKIKKLKIQKYKNTKIKKYINTKMKKYKNTKKKKNNLID